ncbi:MAG: hypothetical protein IAE83_03625 [Anaerolinea sp.]|nr:hypothetical protein [Anaerolinea sp.]
MAPNVLTLFAEPAVALLYYMTVIILSCAALFMALGQRMRGETEKAASRYMIASAGVTVSWLLLMVGAVVVLLTNQPSAAIMPPLDRAVGALVVALVGWAFLVTDQESLQGDPPGFGTVPGIREEPPLPELSRAWLNLLLSTVIIGIVLGYTVTAYQWLTTFSPTASFNSSGGGIVWMMGTIILAGFMLVLLVVRFRKTPDAPLKMLFFVSVLGGYLYTLITVQEGAQAGIGNESGAIRLAFLAAMPLLPVVIYRLVVERLTMMIQERAAEATVSALTTISNNLVDTTAERESVTLLKALGLILERDKPEDLPRQIVISACNMLKADVCALLVMDDAEYADVLAAFDAVQNRHIAAMAFKLDEQPTLQGAIQDRLQHVLLADMNLNEIVDVYTRLDIQKVGPVYFQPLSREGEVNGVLVIAFPYTQRDLRQNEKRLLESLAPIASRMLAISRAAGRAVTQARGQVVQAVTEGTETLSPEAPTPARLEMQNSLEVARQQINELSGKVRELQIELDFERSRLSELASNDPEGLSISQRMERIQTERSQLESERERLMQALQEAQAQLASATGGDDELYKTAIQLLTQERDELYTQKEQLENELNTLRQGGDTQAPQVLKEMLTRLTEEKSRLSNERDQLKSNLEGVTKQLTDMGIESSPGGLLSTLMQITEERNSYKTLSDRALQERNLLIGEFRKFRDRISRERERDAKIAALENEVRRLAQDKEVLIRQRDTLGSERYVSDAQRVEWDATRQSLQKELDTLKVDLDAALVDRNRVYAEMNKFAEEKAILMAERDKLLAARAALQTERDQLAARIEGNRELLHQLGADGVDALKKMINDLTEERSDLEHKLLQAEKSIKALKEKTEHLMKRQEAIKDAAPRSGFDEETAAVLLSVAQELRTPLNAISAYVDLLLGESVGILGELQRQFLQRVKANGDRLVTLIEDFVRVVAIDTGQLKLKTDQVDMSEVIEDAITSTRAQFREKGITLNLELPEQMPLLTGDRGALTQVVVELLSNAYRASPTDGEVSVKAQPIQRFALTPRNGAEGEGEPSYADVILVDVRDNGGGVPTEEQPRVFSRLYRADRPLIKGLGDTGVGLSVAKALTEAHQGRIWLDTTPGESSTFRVALPLQSLRKLEHVAS